MSNKEMRTIQFEEDGDIYSPVDEVARESIGDISSLNTSNKTNLVNAINEIKTNSLTEETDPTVPDWAKEPTKPTYTASEVGADASGTASSLINTHNNSSDSHSDIREAINNKLNSSELSNAINTALNLAKESGEFDGADGKDGTSVTVKSVSESTADGGSNVVTFSDGKTVTIKNGSKGSKGADGKTPVKGTDYGTPADIEAITQEVLTALGTPVVGRVDADKNVILTGDLNEGTYTFSYMDKEGKLTEIGTYTGGKKEDVIIEPVWHYPYKLNSSTGVADSDSANTYAYCDGIPFEKGTELWISCSDRTYFTCFWYFYNDAGSFVGKTDWMGSTNPGTVTPMPEAKITPPTGATAVKLRCNVSESRKWEKLERLTVVRKYV